MNKAAFELRNWLKERGMMQRFLAERLDIDPAVMSKILAGIRRPTLKLAAKIEEVTKGRVKMKDWTVHLESEAT